MYTDEAIGGVTSCERDNATLARLTQVGFATEHIVRAETLGLHFRLITRRNCNNGFRNFCGVAVRLCQEQRQLVLFAVCLVDLPVYSACQETVCKQSEGGRGAQIRFCRGIAVCIRHVVCRGGYIFCAALCVRVSFVVGAHFCGRHYDRGAK